MTAKVPARELSIGGVGPPPIPNGRGREQLLREEPYYDVHLDAGTFDWLWRIVEARALQHQNSVTTSMLVPAAVEVSRKAVIAFRDAAAATGLPPPLPKKRRRVVKVPKSG